MVLVVLVMKVVGGGERSSGEGVVHGGDGSGVMVVAVRALGWLRWRWWWQQQWQQGTVTPRCFVNCLSQLVCSGLGLERHRMEV